MIDPTRPGATCPVVRVESDLDSATVSFRILGGRSRDAIRGPDAIVRLDCGSE